MPWSASVGTTSKTAFTACGTLSPPCRGRRSARLSPPVLQAHDAPAPT
ncbi:hypothetical protein EYF80_066692 [Liparis tanakae]|uniref:Uncharacterized protein n=1 Tax=Liparis tanakae TaxID=230148 RepID=A0A4Z2E3Q6_9TELE|nr:hypothetical protein EYF80_066692 [Liparis tanakae]